MTTPQSFTMKLNSKKQVLDLSKGTMGNNKKLAPKTVVQGCTYLVTLDSNITYSDTNMPMHKAVIFNTTVNNPYGWMYVVDTQKPIDITMGSDKVYALIMDDYIQDNKGSATLTFSPVSLTASLKNGTVAFTPDDKGDGTIKKDHAIKFVNDNVGSHLAISFKGPNPFNNIEKEYKFSIPAQGAVFKIAINCGTFDLKHNKFDVDCLDDCLDDFTTLTSGEIIVTG